MTARDPKLHHLVMTSPARRAILQYLQMHGEATREQLLDLQRPGWRITADTAPTKHNGWLSGHLAQLRAYGYIGRRSNAAGELVWFLGADSDPVPLPEAEPQPELETVKPRVVNLFGAVYKPAPAPPVRPGAMAYASHPSLVSGSRVPYRNPSDPSPTRR